MIDLNETARVALETAKRRAKKGQLKSDTMSILKHCAGEVVEATDGNPRKRGENINLLGTLSPKTKQHIIFSTSCTNCKRNITNKGRIAHKLQQQSCN